MRFAAWANKLTRADPPADYWNRARRLAPTDPDLWYFSGVQQISDGHPDDAWASWRRSLELSGRHLNEIVDAAARVAPDPRRRVQLLLDILPNNPEWFLLAAQRLEKEPTADGPTRPLLERGRDLLKEQPEPLTPLGYYLRARFNDLLEDYDTAVRSYDLALSMAPDKFTWRVDYIKLLMNQEKWREANRELVTLRRQFSNPEIENWFKVVQRQLMNQQ
jgi:tetratricopeptide (TPR) repeat protein